MKSVAWLAAALFDSGKSSAFEQSCPGSKSVAWFAALLADSDLSGVDGLQTLNLQLQAGPGCPPGFFSV